MQVHGYPMDANFKKQKESTSNYDMIDHTMYIQLIVSLMYLKKTRPHICFSMNRVLRYLHGTVGYGLRYSSGCDMILQGFFYSYWVDVLQIGRVILDVASVWVLQLFPSVAGRIPQ